MVERREFERSEKRPTLLDEFLRARAKAGTGWRPFRARVLFPSQVRVDAAQGTFLSHGLKFELLSATDNSGVVGDLVGTTVFGDNDLDDWLRWILYPAHAELLGWTFAGGR
jgi:hypothetical protein